MGALKRRSGIWPVLLGFVAIQVVLLYMALAPGLWKLGVFALALVALGYLAATRGYDSRDGKDW